MFAPIVNWLLAGWGGNKQALTPLMPDTTLETQGRELLSARSKRMQILQEIRDLMIGLPMQSRPALVDHVAARFAMYVVDLPASERDHDSGDFGLLDHSLAVARSTVGELVRPGFRVSEDPAANYREQPIWAYSGFVLGLLHDVGKVFDLDVLPRGEGATWNPVEEPLMAFLGRQRLSGSGRGSWRWKKGRGLNGHVWKGNALAPLILPSACTDLLGPRLRVLLETFTRSYAEGKEDWGTGPAGRVVQAVRHWDRTLAKGDLRTRQELPVLNSPNVQSISSEPDRPGTSNAVCTAPSPAASNALSPASAEVASESPRPSPKPPAVPQGAGNQARAPKQYLLDRKPTPEECRLRNELEPNRFIETIRSWVRSGNASRNGVHADMFVCPEFIWFRYPHALRGILESVKLNWSGNLGEKVLAILLKHPLVAPLHRTEVLVPATPTSREADLRQFVRIKAADFLPAKELETLGLWSPGLTVVSTSPPGGPLDGLRSIEMRRAG